MARIALAFRSCFGILFQGKLPEDVARAFGYERPAPKPARVATASDGALQLLAILQREARLADFLMEDISAYADAQVGAVVRNLHDQCRDALKRHVRLKPVIDGVEGTFMRLEGADPAAVRLVGKVPADGKAPGGMLRHKGWRAEHVELPALSAGQDTSIVAPAEVEIE